MRPTSCSHLVPLVLAPFLALACAGPSLPDRPVLSQHPLLQRDFRLGSGLRVVVQEDHSTPLVVVTSIYGVGATSDPPGAEGLAHFIEHLAFRARMAGAPLADRLKRAGATYNASTRPDTTQYYAIAYRDAWAELLEMDVWRLGHVLEDIAPEEFETERQVVLNERRQRLRGLTGSSVLTEVAAQLFPAGHPLARSFIGTEASLAAITPAQARAFVDKQYRPDNCTVVIAGDVKSDEVAALIRRWPAALVESPDGPQAPPREHRPPLARAEAQEPPEPVSLAPRFIKGAVTSRRLLLAWSLPPLSRDNQAELDVVSAAIGMTVARASASSRLIPLANGSVAIVEATFRPKETVEQARDRVLLELVGPSAALAAGGNATVIKWSAQSSILRAIADPVASAMNVSNHLITTGRATYYRDTMQHLAEVSTADVAAFLRRYVTSTRAVTLVIEPDVVAVAGDDEGDVAGAAAGEEPHELGRTSALTLANMNSHDVLRVARPPGLGALPRFSLPNHLEVVAVQRPEAPIARIHLQLRGGDASVQPYGLAGLASLMSGSSCRFRNGDLYQVAGAMSRSWGALSTSLAVTVPDGNLVNGLGVLADEVECREVTREQFGFFEKAVERRKKEIVSAQRRADTAFWDALYPGHPFGKSDDPGALGNVDRNAVSAFVGAHYRPEGAAVVVVSSRPGAEVKPLVENYFSAWTAAPAGGPTMLPPPPPPGPSRRAVHVFDGPKGPQAYVRVGCRLPAVTPETLPAFEVLRKMLSEQAWQQLRESWGATYGMQVAVGFFPGSSHLVIEGEIVNGKAGGAVGRLLAMIDADATAGPDGRTFVLSRWDVARAFNYRFATSAGVTQAVLTALNRGWSPSVWDEFPARLAQVGRGDLRSLLKDCAGHEVITVVGDASALKKQLEAVAK